MENEAIVIKSEPVSDEYESALSLPTDQMSANRSTCLLNGFSDEVAPRENSVPKASAIAGSEQEERTGSNTNFSCLLCDVICENRDDLRKHLKTDHKSKSNFFNQTPGPRSDFYSAYLQFRYTCNFCGAKFKTFKNYFSHSMSHKGYGNLQSSLNEAMLRSGKDVLQNYFDAEEGYPGTFRCDECKTVFMQRDSYAMHMMMRAMNETCRPTFTTDLNSQTKTEPIDNTVPTNSADHYTVPGTSVDDTGPQENDVSDSVSNGSQKCLEDITCKVDQDVDLKSVLDKVVTQNGTQDLSENKFTDVGKPCIFCGQAFIDQDSLAMHVMSIHADQMFVMNPKRNNVAPKPKDNLSWPSPYLYPLDCKYCGKKFVSRDNLAMHVLTHTQEDKSDSGRDGSLFSLKRKAEAVKSLPEPSVAINMKMAKESHATDKQIITNGILSASDLYCSLCLIQFYSKGDFEWHLRCRHNQSGNEPLCLTKQEVKVTDNLDLDDTKMSGTNVKRTRRNSFSVDEKSRHQYVTPKRPISADTITNSKSDDRKSFEIQNGKTNSSDSNDGTSNDLKIKKEIQRSMAIACVDALSSNEKRIIYSVFGTELLKNKENDNGMKQSKEPHDKINGQRQNLKTVPQEYMTQHFKQISRDSQISKTSAASSPKSDDDLQSALKGKDAAMCRYCEIIFLNKAMYYLHMGLHNVNNQWQCNVCGKACKGAVDFAAHIIHM